MKWNVIYKICLPFVLYVFQEDLTVDDINTIIDELKAGKKPKPGPRFVLANLFFWHCQIANILSRRMYDVIQGEFVQ